MNIIGNFFGFVWQEVLFRPIFNLVAFFYNVGNLQDFGVALIFATIVIKLATFSITASSRKNQFVNQKVQEEINEVKKRFGHNKEVLAKKIGEIYKENKINPLSSCLPIIVQIFIFSALWRVINSSLGKDFDQNLLYPFLKNSFSWPKELNQNFLGIFDLRSPASSTIFGLLIVSFSALVQYIQVAKFSPQIAKPDKDATDQEKLTYQMYVQTKFMAPLFTFMFVGLPLGLNLYSTISGIITILQTIFMQKFYKQENLDREKMEEEKEKPKKDFSKNSSKIKKKRKN